MKTALGPRLPSTFPATTFAGAVVSVALLFCLLCICITVPIVESQVVDVSSDFLMVSFPDDSLGFSATFLDHGVDVGNYMTWTYSRFSEASTTPSFPGDSLTNLLPATTLYDITTLTYDEPLFQRVDQNSSLSDSGEEIVYPNGTYPSLKTVSTENYLLNDDYNFTFADETHFVVKGGLKFSLVINNWPFQASGLLYVYTTIELSAQDLKSDFEFETLQNGNLQRIIIRGSNQAWVVSFAQNYLQNGETMEMTYLQATNIEYETPNKANVTVLMVFPSCGKTFECVIIYDPDISALIEPNKNNDGGSGSSDDSSDDELMIILVSVLIPVAVLTVVVVVVSILVVLAIRRAIPLFRPEEAVNF